MQDGRKENAHLHYEDIITIENIELNRPKRTISLNKEKTFITGLKMRLYRLA